MYCMTQSEMKNRKVIKHSSPELEIMGKKLSHESVPLETIL